MAPSAVTPQATAWDEQGNPVQPQQPATTSASAWDEQGNPVSSQPPVAPTDSVSAVKPPQGMSETVARWAENVSNDIKYGTDNTGVGTVLKKLGAHGVYAGEPEAVGDFMASMPLGLLKATKGAGEVGQGKLKQGASDIGSGALQASTMPAAFVAPEAPDAVAEGASKLLPSTERAGAALQGVKNVAGEVPVNMDEAGKTVMELVKQAERGGDTVSAISKLQSRLESGEAITYEEAKDFQSNISALSANDKMSFKPNTFRLLGKLNGELKEALTDAADTQGKGQEFIKAMKEYHNSMRLKEWTDEAKATAIKYAMKAAGVYGLAKIFKVGSESDH